MNFLRMHWFDLGLALAVVAGGFILLTRPVGLSLILWLSLMFLFVHQFEEYRYPGYFPGMVNTVLYGSSEPDRYPLNANTSLVVNVVIGWLFYLAAAVLGDRAVWLGIATILVSVGNVIAHTVLFNLRGKTFYNPGMATALVLFLPLAVTFFAVVVQSHAASTADWLIGVVLGLMLNYVGIMKLIDWLKDEHTPYVFPTRCAIPRRLA
ncbi:MAG TPA: HXXEE domain-containing protein [Chloroflexota bacterium]|nr:HXXEE domain-containing protein [Chloroflexota bacterium]